jgi:hypothetical protein
VDLDPLNIALLLGAVLWNGHGENAIFEGCADLGGINAGWQFEEPLESAVAALGEAVAPFVFLALLLLLAGDAQDPVLESDFDFCWSIPGISAVSL